MTNRNFWLGAILLSSALFIAGTANAYVLSMSGTWYQNRGPLVDIPANGGPVFCTGGLSTGCVNTLKPLNGGIPAVKQHVPIIPGTGTTNPAGFTIPKSAFALAGGAANRQTVPVVGIPTVIQLASQFSLAGPGVTPLAGGIAKFQKNAWSNDPGQSARLGPNFTWCPPTGNCATTTLSQTYGAYRAQIKYTGGVHNFGGTMAMMLSDTGVVSIAIGGGQVLHQLVGGTSNPTPAPQMGGAGYAAYRSLVLDPGPVHAPYTIGTACTSAFGQQPAPPGCGVITNQGALLFSLPGSINHDWGMPCTTGTIFNKNLPGPIPAQDPATTFFVVGTDSRTAAGAGKITMVAGATTERLPSGNHFSALEVVTMDFGPDQIPGLSASALMALTALLLVGGGFFVRKRFALEN